MLAQIKEFLKGKKSLKDVLYMMGSQVALQPISVLKSFMVAKYLGPEHYGILKSVELVTMLNKFGSLGFLNVAVRDATTAKAQNDETKLISTKNNAYTGEILLSVLLTIIGCLSALFFENKLVQTALVLASIGLFTAKLFNIFKVEMRLNQEFKLLSKILLVHGYINALSIIATVPFFNLNAVLIVPIISTLAMALYTLKKMGRFFELKIDKEGFKEVLKIGVPLTIGTLCFGLFRYTERILIISFLGLTAMAYYGFATTITSIFVSLLLTSVMKVRSIRIYEELGKSNFKKVHKMVVKESAMLILMSLVFIVLIAVGMKVFVPMFLEKWTEAINIAILLSLVLPIKLSSSYVAAVIKSPTINKLRFEPKVQLIGTAIMVLATLALKFSDSLTLTNFVIVNLVAYAFVNLSFVYYYYLTFMKPRASLLKG